MTYRGSDLALGKPLGDRNSRPVLPLSASPNVFVEIDPAHELYISRVFSPSNSSGIASGTIGSKYDFMVAISGPSVMNS